MAFDFARNHDDPGIPSVARLALGAIDVPIRRRKRWPERLMDWVCVAFWVAMGFAIVGSFCAAP